MRGGSMHPGGLFYTPRTIRQEIDRIFGVGRDRLEQQSLWRVAGGYVHPFKDPTKVFRTLAELRSWSERLDRAAEELFSTADVVIVTLGLIEGWWDPKTGNHFRQIPHPVPHAAGVGEFRRLTVAEIVEDLTKIRARLREHGGAELILTVSPVPLLATFTPSDVRVANTESKARLRAAVSEFIDAFSDVHYFHSYEIVETSERRSDFMLEDGRHVVPRAVDYIVEQFFRAFGTADVRIPTVDASFMAPIAKRAAPPTFRESRIRRGIRALRRRIRALRPAWPSGAGPRVP